MVFSIAAKPIKKKCHTITKDKDRSEISNFIIDENGRQSTIHLNDTSVYVFIIGTPHLNLKKNTLYTISQWYIVYIQAIVSNVKLLLN